MADSNKKNDDTAADIRIDEMRLMQLVAMFQMAAMQQLGKLVNPVTNEVERNLVQARASIDMIETLKRKTEGNRSASETEFIDKVLFELHMNYVDESNRNKRERSEKKQTTGSEAADTDGNTRTDGASEETTDPE